MNVDDSDLRNIFVNEIFWQTFTISFAVRVLKIAHLDRGNPLLQFPVPGVATKLVVVWKGYIVCYVYVADLLMEGEECE